MGGVLHVYVKGGFGMKLTHSHIFIITNIIHFRSSLTVSSYLCWALPFLSWPGLWVSVAMFEVNVTSLKQGVVTTMYPVLPPMTVIETFVHQNQFVHINFAWSLILIYLVVLVSWPVDHTKCCRHRWKYRTLMCMARVHNCPLWSLDDFIDLTSLIYMPHEPLDYSIQYCYITELFISLPHKQELLVSTC